MRDDAVLRRALPLGRGLGRVYICYYVKLLNSLQKAADSDMYHDLTIRLKLVIKLDAVSYKLSSYQKLNYKLICQGCTTYDSRCSPQRARVWPT